MSREVVALALMSSYVVGDASLSRSLVSAYETSWSRAFVSEALGSNSASARASKV